MPSSESRARCAEAFDAVTDRDEVVISESSEETDYLLRSPENARRLLASIQRLEQGTGVSHDLCG